ncbi:hypothetical protein BG011_008611 [Mortierella polycephala]|uniref:SUN domain-containing protein n=1 Tax=Mortierella polycephala TaxID=41804 RepID=A0A9P6Q9E2_9FUNG|nr:hypothetical protein BG011_008611 [Mortierella polycephala]
MPQSDLAALPELTAGHNAVALDKNQDILAATAIDKDAASTEEGHVVHQHITGATTEVASNTTTAESVVVDPQQSTESATTASDAKITVTGGIGGAQRDTVSHGNHDHRSEETAILPPPPLESIRETRSNPTSKTPATPVTTTHPQHERYIPSYEQWRKQVLEKKRKPADPNERNKRKRKPYQESAVDVAIGSEDEIGFVFPNMDSGNGNGKSGDDRFQHVADQLGNGPDLKQSLSMDKEWIKSEYAKDPRDRFNHASATCAASIARASKDATSIMAILNEGKDNYMLNKCTTKDKFFVVELCEEILVDTFVLGNYEFFSSTFRDFVVSVNRYPPRDDGWSILGHFRARNTRDAQVFKPAVPQLATYIRFDFVNHYGNEYYCPITLLRVYGATALEQLKQEEEEEKRLAEEEKRLAELEKVRQAEADDAEDAEDMDDEKMVKVSEDKKTDPTGDNTTVPIKIIEVDSSGMSASERQPEITDTHDEGDTLQLSEIGSPSPVVIDTHSDHQLRETDEPQKGLNNIQHETESSTNHPEVESPTFVFPDRPSGETEEDLQRDNPAASTDATWKLFEGSATLTTDSASTDVLPPLPSTSPASMQDDGDWQYGDLGMVTLSQKIRPTHIPKPSSPGVGTTSGGASSATDSNSHPVPSPQHSSQESVYKNIVNRLKVLELNSTLSYQYLEEQSNIFNEVIETSEQKINQLVSHLNEANRRLETLGRKYDQLAYSFRAHVEIDGEKRRQDFNDLSSQVHLLGSQVMFQRQLFIVCTIILLSVVASIAITRSSSMHYALQQSPLGAKLRAISGHRSEARPEDISSSVRIGSVVGLSQFDHKSMGVQHPDEGQEAPVEEDLKFASSISPMAPLTPGRTQSQSRLLSVHEATGEPSLPESDLPHQNGDTADRDHSEDTFLTNSHAESDVLHQEESPDLKQPDMLSDRFIVTRTPYSTPKNSHGSNRQFLFPQSISSAHQPYPNDYRPDSPVFQGPSSVHDEGHLSDADVAYMSRDMNVGRQDPSSGSTPVTPTMKRLSASYYNQFHHQAYRRSSTLRMDATASIASPERSESASPEETRLTQNEKPHNSAAMFDGSRCELDSTDKDRRDEALVDGDSEAMSLVRTPKMTYKEEEEDVGFVSDSVLDSTAESVSGSQKHLQNSSSLGEWEKQHGIGEELASRHDDDEERDDMDIPVDVMMHGPLNGRTTMDGKGGDSEAQFSTRSSTKQRRRRSSHSIHRSLEHAMVGHNKNHSASAAIGLGVELDGHGQEEDDEVSLQVSQKAVP